MGLAQGGSRGGGVKLTHARALQSVAPACRSWDDPDMSQPDWEIKPPPRGADLPYDDGEAMDSERHRLQMELAIESIRAAWGTERQDAYAAGNMALYFSERQARNNDFRAPDVFLVFGAERRERLSWVVWEEGGKVPDVVIEITSPSTEAVDRGTKLRIYGSVLHVPFYAIFDPFSGALDAFEYAEGRLRPLAPDAAGRVYCAPAELFLGVRRGTFHDVTCDWLRWITPAGTVLPHEEERAEAEHARADAEHARADAEHARADASAEAVERLRSKLVAAGIDPDAV